MKRLLVIEDQPNDLQIAAEAARSAGFETIEARTSSQAAMRYLERGIAHEVPLPHAILLDLDLGYESGYELLRFWHSTPALRGITLIVWSLLGEEQRQICNLFKVNGYISKWEGIATLRGALAEVFSGSNNLPG